LSTLEENVSRQLQAVNYNVDSRIIMREIESVRNKRLAVLIILEFLYRSRQLSYYTQFILISVNSTALVSTAACAVCAVYNSVRIGPSAC
jgi:hypothetical protein